MSNAQEYRSKALGALTNDIGVYALCDLDGQPIYVGQSVDGIRSRVRRHLTSARSDVIANRQIDVWEIAFVWAWPVMEKADVQPLEDAVFQHFDAEQPLMNGKSLSGPVGTLDWPEKQQVQVIEETDRLLRLDPAQRLPRQIQQYNLLVDYILTVKDAAHLKRSLEAHFQRLVKYHKTFL
ncbi:GIY-YIG nuclease family protein [Sulfitobacter sp. M57]|uniref:GIY-YIG nuclease family protein n=1 Tax=unclassified Sulfitobacter TaxID=196795 RepID=UPI0023E2A610|nr:MULTISPECIES: GIY-YIG nuclease family protein [unclassified Sulfitobacter]MDF3413530.1 GIY-YIG nuclease family protein [Sulfitobacter sp. KE5]MDF3421188.1 GIY-YIG nuclease family protein [Sulfitobacter sp. KE43]MDF3432077.1 GIY-YIG nuclease family protein [Sulfitobacter sp. KE42]MDF3457717.1 GIY-YIG nuclease family protein [Sulfitobacter sp. S74]MDF3461619.1 GIY-YIG nuclease family protein [Sulfitobacter sp. Ks18]